MNKNGIRGMTLAETCVVIAVTSLISVALLSFTVIVIRESRTSLEHLDTMRELRLAEELIENEIEATGNIEKVEFNSESKQLNIDGKAFSFSTITEIIFDTEKNGDALYICRLKYQLNGESSTYTFCVNPYVGDVIGGVSQ
ncbi:MAG: hypothetical protein IJW03_05890 [Clostridia bacterium]|nr:hypothetical protein [Clostridia bacterium]